jgi:glutamyl-tRNA reductase
MLYFFQRPGQFFGRVSMSILQVKFAQKKHRKLNAKGTRVSAVGAGKVARSKSF